MSLHNLRPPKGARQKKGFRVGRGHGSGNGKNRVFIDSSGRHLRADVDAFQRSAVHFNIGHRFTGLHSLVF